MGHDKLTTTENMILIEFIRATSENVSKIIYAMRLSIIFGHESGLIAIHWSIWAILQTQHNDICGC